MLFKELDVALTAAHTRTVRRSHLPLWLILSGAVTAIIGGIVMHQAAGRRAFYEDVSGYARAMGDPYPDPRLAAAISLSHLGFGILIIGLVVAAIGLIGQVVRR